MFRMIVVIQKFILFPLLLHFFYTIHAVTTCWCVPAHQQDVLFNLLLLIFVPFLKSQPDCQGCGSLSCTCAVLLWELPPVFSLSVCWSLCQTSLIPQTLMASQGRHAPSFHSTRADRGLHAGVISVFASVLVASLVTKSCQQQQLLMCCSSYSTLSAVF